MITLIICEKCKRILRHGEWIIPSQEVLDQLRELYKNGQAQSDHCYCDLCKPT